MLQALDLRESYGSHEVVSSAVQMNGKLTVGIDDLARAAPMCNSHAHSFAGMGVLSIGAGIR